MKAPYVHIHYLRPPDRKEVFHQRLLLDRDDVKVTLASDIRLDSPIRIGADVVLENGSDAVWFTFPGAWHDIGRFHTADGEYRGLYANVLTPADFGSGLVWHTTDLFLDVWLAADGSSPAVLDRAQFEEAVRKGWVHASQARRAEAEVSGVLGAWKRGAWPPPIVEEWPLERARDLVTPPG